MVIHFKEGTDQESTVFRHWHLQTELQSLNTGFTPSPLSDFILVYQSVYSFSLNLRTAWSLQVISNCSEHAGRVSVWQSPISWPHQAELNKHFSSFTFPSFEVQTWLSQFLPCLLFRLPQHLLLWSPSRESWQLEKLSGCSLLISPFCPLSLSFLPPSPPPALFFIHLTLCWSPPTPLISLPSAVPSMSERRVSTAEWRWLSRSSTL